MDRKTAPGKAKVKPKLKVTCGRCGHPLGNPLTHRCVTKTDFRQRKASFEREQARLRKPAPKGNAHEPAGCTDEHCPRYPCRMYKEGKDDGRREGYDEGHAKGHAEGYGEGWDAGYRKGFPDGMAACPRPHGKG